MRPHLPDDRLGWERILRDLGFTEIRPATHGSLWERGTARFMLPRMAGKAKHLDPRMRKNLWAQLQRAIST